MFDFEKLDIYKKAKSISSEIRSFIRATKLDPTSKDQLRRVSFSIVLNISEGIGKFSKADRRNYFTTARASVFECIAILDILCDGGQITTSELEQLMNKVDEFSRILYTMIKNLS